MAKYEAVRDVEDAAAPAPTEKPARGRTALFRGACVGGVAVLAVCAVSLYRARHASDALLFFDDFHSLDPKRWNVERSLDDGGNGEFQAYTDDPSVVSTKSGRLIVQPKPMDKEAWAWLSGGKAPDDVRSALEDGTTLKVKKCTGEPCEHASKWDEPLAPVVSAKLTTKDKFAFRYGTAEVRLKMPVGDWIWPAIWLLPADNAYGPWPFSGELDLLEARGNGADFEVVGSAQSGLAGKDHLAATVHCADSGGGDAFSIGNTTVRRGPGGLEDDEGFVIVGVEWTRESVVTYAREQGGRRRVLATYSDTSGPLCDNKAYKGRGSNAPFDREFYFVLNVAVGGCAGGGVAYWGDDVLWKKCDHPHMCDPRTDFADREDEWLPSWTRGLEVDWVRVTRE